MRQFKTVLKFEYLNFIKSKFFVGITIFFVVICLAFSFFPQISAAFSGTFGGDGEDAAEPAAFYDESGVYTSDLLAAYAPGYAWTKLDSLSDAESLVENETYTFVAAIDGLDVTIYERGSDAMSSVAASVMTEVVRLVYQAVYLETAGLDAAEVAAVLTAEPMISTVMVGKDVSNSFWVSYVIIFLLYFALIFYGSSVSGSVTVEKTSKAMELLITSASPMSLMFGKVIGTGLAGLTQLGLILLSVGVGFNLNMDAWMEMNPMMGAVLQSSVSMDLILLAIVYFLLSFFSFAFIYAGLASTVSRVEDANSVTIVPTFLLVIVFIVCMQGMFNPEAFYMHVLSYVPFFSPMIMAMRMCILGVGAMEVIISIAANVVYILIFGFICSRIYRVGIMLYGNKPKLRQILGYIKNAG